MDTMRRWSVVVLGLGALLPGPLWAYGFCSEPSAPDVPNGSYAEDYQMDRARREIEDYLNDVAEYKECLIRAMRETDAEAEGVIDEWNTAVRRYNSR
jgi:hypothetical protein